MDPQTLRPARSVVLATDAAMLLDRDSQPRVGRVVAMTPTADGGGTVGLRSPEASVGTSLGCVPCVAD